MIMEVGKKAQHEEEAAQHIFFFRYPRDRFDMHGMEAEKKGCREPRYKGECVVMSAPCLDKADGQPPGKKGVYRVEDYILLQDLYL